MAAVINVPWTEEEIDLLRETKGVDEYMREALIRGYTYRTPGAIRFQRTKRRLIEGRKEWTEKEIDILCQVYPDGGVSAVVTALRLRGYERTEEAIRKRVTKLGIANQVRESRPWTEEEEDFLINYYPWVTARQVQLMLEDAGFTRTIRSIRWKANQLGVVKGEDYYGD